MGWLRMRWGYWSKRSCLIYTMKTPMTRPPLPGPEWRYIEGAELEKPLPMDAMTFIGSEWYASTFRGIKTPHSGDDIFYATRTPLPATEPTDSGWRDIASAPKDGTEVLVWCPPAHGLPSLTRVCGYHEDAGFCVCELREPTHWQPLPAPPAIRSAMQVKEGGE
jgi:hypothetical protein